MASKNIKGIVIEIDGNTKPLSNALSDLNKDVQAVNKDLRQVNDALKLDPGNAEQVARKLELLDEKADLAAKKVEALKQAQAKMDAEGVDKASSEYQSLSTEIAKAEGEQRKIAQTAKDTQAEFDKVSESTKLLNTYLEATGQSIDDLKNIEGISRLVSDFEAGSLGAAGFDKVLKAIAADATGSAKNLDEVKAVLASIESGNSLEGIKQDLEAIGKVNVSGLGAEFDQLSAKSQALDTELNTINERLKLDPSNIEMVAQKQEVLTQNISATEGQLQILKSRYSELSSQGLDLGDEQFRNVQRDITDLEGKLTSYKSNLSDLENAQNRLNTYFEATGTSARDFSNILGSDLVQKIERGEASSQELANALDKIGASATQNRGDIDRFKEALDGVDNGVSFDKVKSELDQLGQSFNDSSEDASGFKESLDKIAENTGAEKLAEIGEQVGEVGDKLKEFGAGAVEAAGTVQSSQSQIQMSLGVTKEEAAAVADHVHSVWAQNFGETQEEVTEVMVNIQKQIQDVNDSNIEDITKKFMTLQAQGLDNEEALRAVNSTMMAFGVDSNTALDMVQSGLTNINDPMHEIGDVLSEYAPHFKQAGYSGEEMLAVLKAGGDAGARSLDLVADLIKEMGIRLSDGSIASAVTDLDEQFSGMGVNFQGVMDDMTAAGASPKEIFQALMGEINKLPNDMDKATAASALFGSQAEDCTIPVIEAIAAAGDEYGNFAGAADQAVQANDTAVGSMQRKWEDLGTKFAPLGEDLAELANKILDVVVPAVQSVVDWFTNLPEPVKTVIEVVGALVAGLTALGPVINLVAAPFKLLWSVLSTVGTAISAVVGVLGGPLTLAIGAVIAVIVGLIAYFNNWGGCADWLNEKWSEFTTWLSDTFSGLGESIGGAWQGFIDTLSGAWDGLCSGLQTAWETVTGWLSTAFSSIGETVGGAWNTFTSGISTAWDNIWSGIQSGWETVTGWFSTIFEGLNLGEMWNTVVSTIQTTWDSIWTNIQAGWEVITGWFSTVFASLNLGELWNMVVGTIQSTWDTIWTNIQTGWEAVTGWFSTIFEGLNLGELWNTVTSGISDTWNTVWTGVQTFWQTIAEWFGGIFDGLNIGELWNNAISGIQTAWDTIWGNIQTGWDTITGWIGDAFTGVKDMITGTWDESKQQTQTNWNAMGDIVKASVQGMNEDSAKQLLSLSNSLMNTFQEAEKNTDMSWEDIEKSVTQASQGMNDDVKQKLPEMLSQMKTVWDEGHRETDDKWGQIRDSVTSKAQEIKDNLSGKWNDVVSDFSRIWGDLKNKASEIWENVKRTVQDAIERIKGMMNFHWELPKIQLPHFNISGNFSLNPPSVPNISIDWYKKGGILTKPVLFGMNGNSLLGGGEAGKEAVAPIDTLTDYVENAVNGSNAGMQQELSEIKDLLSSFCEAALNKEFNVNIDGKSVASAITPQVDKQLGMLQQRKRRQ